MKLNNVICLNCGKEFQSKEANPNAYPKYCSECLESGGKCPMCGKNMPVKRKFCSKECSEKNVVTISGHKKQGKKIKGENNPAKRDDVRQKIALGVCKSYINNPELRASRGNHSVSRRRNFTKTKYLDGRGNILKSKIELGVAQFLQQLGLDYEYEHQLFINGHYRYPDFKIKNILIEACGYMIDEKTIESYKERLVEYLTYTDFDVIYIVPRQFAYKFTEIEQEFRMKNRHMDLMVFEDGKEVELFVEDVDTVSYSHFLEWYDGPCQHLHSHTSYIIDLYLAGVIKTKWLMDFKEIKVIAKKILEKIDHKVVVYSKYITEQTENQVKIEWKERTMTLLKCDVCIVDFEPTCENLTSWMTEEMLNEFKLLGVTEISLSFREGIDKGVSVYSCIKFYEMEKLEEILGFHLFLPNLKWV